MVAVRVGEMHFFFLMLHVSENVSVLCIFNFHPKLNRKVLAFLVVCFWFFVFVFLVENNK